MEATEASRPDILSESPCGEVILHLSDLHFGYDENVDMRVARTTVLDQLTETLRTIEPDWRPTIVCISGDIAYRASEQDYSEAAAWLRNLLTVLNIDIESVLMCPGNHDVHRMEWKRLPAPRDHNEADEVLRVIDENEPLAPHWVRPFCNFTRFCADLGVFPFDFGTSKSYLVGKRTVKGIDFVSCNSAWFCKGRKTPSDEDHGLLYLGLPHLEYMQGKRQLTMVNDTSCALSVAFLHHPDKCLAIQETESYECRKSPFHMLAECSHLVLSGHTHGRPQFPSRIASSQAHYVVGGATYSGKAYRNNFRLIKVVAGGFILRPYEADPGRSPGYWFQGTDVHLSVRLGVSSDRVLAEISRGEAAALTAASPVIATLSSPVFPSTSSSRDSSVTLVVQSDIVSLSQGLVIQAMDGTGGTHVTTRYLALPDQSTDASAVLDMPCRIGSLIADMTRNLRLREDRKAIEDAKEIETLLAGNASFAGRKDALKEVARAYLECAARSTDKALESVMSRGLRIIEELENGK